MLQNSERTLCSVACLARNRLIHRVVAQADGNQHHFARKDVQKNICTTAYRRKAKSRATGYSGMLIGRGRDKVGRPYIFSSVSVACASGAMVPAGVRQRRVGKGGRLPCAEWILRRGPCAPQTCDAHTTLTAKLFHLVPTSPKNSSPRGRPSCGCRIANAAHTGAPQREPTSL